MANPKQLQDIANILRRDSLKMTAAAGSGHPSSCLSCAEIMSVLFFNQMKYDAKNPNNQNNDEFILSKGHAAPILYSALFHASCIKENLLSLRKINSPLEGHPIPKSISWVKVATGSLGQGLAVGVGMALAGKMQGREFRTFVLLGDSEMTEGSNYEAMQLASYYKLNNLIVIIDVNRLGQTGETIHGWRTSKYKKKFEAFGWGAKVVNGHNINEILSAFDKAKTSKKPFVIIAKTSKGKGVGFIENKNNWHGKVLSEKELVAALKELPNPEFPKVTISKPKNTPIKNKTEIPSNSIYEIGAQISTREAYGLALRNLASANPNVIAVDAEVSNSTYSEEVKKFKPNQFVETFISEQSMVGICLGLSKKGFNVFGSTFGAFLSRAHDQIRMSALSEGNFTLCGSHAGVSIGEDGASQMALEDIAMFRTLPNSTIFYPSDAVSTEKLVFLAANTNGLKYIRTTRGKTPVIYSQKEKFDIGEFKIIKQSAQDKIVLVGAGITLHECLKAHSELKNTGINSAVVDLYCIKPFNCNKFISFVKKHGNKIVVAEDHYAEGGIGEMLASNLVDSGIKLIHLAIKEIPHSGKPKELLEKYRINSSSIAKIAENSLNV